MNRLHQKRIEKKYPKKEPKKKNVLLSHVNINTLYSYQVMGCTYYEYNGIKYNWSKWYNSVYKNKAKIEKRNKYKCKQVDRRGNAVMKRKDYVKMKNKLKYYKNVFY